jgi:16S rRNA (guanine527-N7)-methyltransferase
MSGPEAPPVGIGQKLNRILVDVGQSPLSLEVSSQFEAYLALLLRWNSITNLTAIRDEDVILRRHFLESIACARALPEEIHTLLDFGSGAGFPGFPIAICRPGIAVTLAESQTKKAAFLREVARVLGIAVEVWGGRAESVVGRTFDCVTLRAVDKMQKAVKAGANLVAPGGWLALLTTQGASAGLRAAAGPAFEWSAGIGLPGAEQRIVLRGRRKN